MKTERNILIAFILNVAFSVFEFVGGVFTGSVAILSDAVHDLGDAVSIGLSYFFERKSRGKPDDTYTYGYARFSVVGSAITTLVLLFGSAVVIYNAVVRIIHPSPINYNGMIVFAVIGMGVNLCAALVTREGESLNQRAVNLHMLEDVLGWAVVLIGSVVMRFTDIRILDPIMSIGIALFILVRAVQNLKEILDLFLEKAPYYIDMADLKQRILETDGVLDAHHMHIWSMDGQNNYITIHIVTNDDPHAVKDRVRHTLAELDIGHATLELETEDEHCHAKDCCPEERKGPGHHHHHHLHKHHHHE